MQKSFFSQNDRAPKLHNCSVSIIFYRKDLAFYFDEHRQTTTEAHTSVDDKIKVVSKRAFFIAINVEDDYGWRFYKLSLHLNFQIIHHENR
jgi:hypothetical protein